MTQFTVGDARRLQILKDKYTCILSDTTQYAPVLFWVSDRQEYEPHEYLAEGSHFHGASLYIGFAAATMTMTVNASNQLIKFGTASGNTWGSTLVIPKQPTLIDPHTKLPHDAVSLVKAEEKPDHLTEGFEIKCIIEPTHMLADENFEGYSFISLIEPAEPNTGEVENSQPVASKEGEKVLKYTHHVFISHASEDKHFARPLAEHLVARGYSVWYDEFELKLGDSLREKIDAGLGSSKHGLVILSPDFFRKEWPARELDGLLSVQTVSGNNLLPIWHNVGFEEVLGYSPSLAGKKGIGTEETIEVVVEAIVASIGPPD